MWKPAILNYTRIGEAFEKEREALLKYINEDVTKMTHFLNIDTEYEALFMYSTWIGLDLEVDADPDRNLFFKGLMREV